MTEISDVIDIAAHLSSFKVVVMVAIKLIDSPVEGQTLLIMIAVNFETGD